MKIIQSSELCPHPRKGVILYIALALMALICFMIYSYHSYVRGDIYHTFHVIDIENADLLCYSALNIAMKHLDQMRIDKLNMQVGSTTEIPIHEDPYIIQLMDRYSNGAAEKLFLKTTVTILTRNQFDNTNINGFTGQFDPVECFGRACIEAQVRYKTVRRFAKDIREYRIVNTTAPVFSHFTLFVKQAGGHGKHGYNVILNDSDGNPSGPIEPLFLNNASHMEYPLEKKGWIFLGGGELILNLSQGFGSGGCGESFHFIQDPTRFELPSDSFVIVNRYLGWFHELEKEEAINRAAGFFKSSYLKLYGKEQDATLTLVLGKVYRSFMRFSAIFDCDAAGIIRNPRLLPYIPPEESELISSVIIRNREGKFMMMKNLSYEDYSRNMSRIIVEPYNRSFDNLLDVKLGRIPLDSPRYLDTDRYYQNIIGHGISSYPNDAKKVKLTSVEGGKYFEGDLNSLDINRYLFDRTSQFFATEDDFIFNLKRRDNVLAGIHRIKEGLNLSNVRNLSGGGMIITDGDIILGPLQSEKPVTLVSLGGDIYLNGPLKNTGLIALQGRIKSSSSIELEGFLATNILDPEDNMKGGRIDYCVDFNPNSDSYRERRTFSISPFSSGQTTGFISR